MSLFVFDAYCSLCFLLTTPLWRTKRRSDVWCSFSYVPLLLMHILARTNIDSSFAHATIRANCHYNDWWVCIKHGWLLWIKRIRYDFPYLRRSTLCEAQLSIVCLMNLPLWLVARLLSDQSTNVLASCPTFYPNPVRTVGSVILWNLLRRMIAYIHYIEDAYNDGCNCPWSSERDEHFNKNDYVCRT